MIAPEQKERCVFGPKVLVFPAESHVRLSPSRTREGVSQESGRAPSLESSFAEERRRRSQRACSCGTMSAMTSKTYRGHFVDMGTRSASFMQSSVRRAIWKTKAGGPRQKRSR